MKILAIESSCDETAAAVVENGTKIISSVIASSAEFHLKTGGVIPEMAAREQVKCIIPVIEEALNLHLPGGRMDSWKVENSIDAIAVTVGPGLIGSLLVGVETAKTLAFSWHKPIIPVNHLVGHIYANWLDVSSLSLRGALATKQSQEIATATSWPRNDNNKKPQFPAICLVVSGGHTELVLMKDHGDLKYLGGTRDDAAGECFDKSARLLGLAPFNGGPSIAAAAAKYTNSTVILGSDSDSRIDSGQVLRPRAQDRGARMTKKILLPRPMINENNLEFSFSGLKTAVLRQVEKLKKENKFNEDSINLLSYELQEAITDVLVAKVLMAIEIYQPKSFLLAGGVAANQRLREKLTLQIGQENSEVKLFVPDPKLCTDNAAYIASCAFFINKPIPWEKITADPGLGIV